MSGVGTPAFDTALSKLNIGRATASSAAAAAANSTRGTSTLDQASFLKLMTAQLKNQDPFKPVDNEQMVAQMAQFSSLAGITEMNATLKGIADKLAQTSTADALAYVGKTVLVPGEIAYPDGAGGLAGAVELAGDAKAVTVSIHSATGALLKTIPLGAAGKGQVDFAWDGITDAGEPAGEGPFRVTVAAQDGAGAVAAQTLVWAPVTSVGLPAAGGSPTLSLLGLGIRSISDIRQIG